MQQLKTALFLVLIMVTLFLPMDKAAADIVRTTDNISNRTTLAVMPFFASGGEREIWLSKGLADILIKDIGQIEKYAVLERSQMQAFVDELSLGSFAGDTKNVLQIGKIAKVNQVLYGYYTLTGKSIKLTVLVYDIDKRDVINVVNRSGELHEIRNLIKDIIVDVSQKSNIKIKYEELENIRFNYTDSLSATQRFYQGIDAYDNGEYADALGEFLAAYQQDKTYNESLFWVARMQESLGMTEHALATYLKLYKNASDDVVAQDGLLFAGKLAQDDLFDNIKAYDIFSKIYNRPELSPHKLIAAFHMAEIKKLEKKITESEGESTYPDIASYKLFKEIADFIHEKQRKPRNLRKSSFYNWSQIYDLNRTLSRHMIEIYAGFDVNLPIYQNIKLPIGTFILDPKDPQLGERYRQTKPFLSVTQKDYAETFYAVIVPKGYKASAVNLKITGECGRCAGSGYDYTIQLHKFPLPRDHFTNWVGTLYGQTDEIATLQKKISFNGHNMSIFILKLNAGRGTISHWGIEANLIKDTGEAKTQTEQENREFLGEGAIVSKVAFPMAEHDGAMQSLQKEFYGSNKREIAMAKDSTGTYHIVNVSGDIKSERTALWHSSSPDAKNWSQSQKLPISSLNKDFAPQFVNAEDGSLHLFWVSNRRGNGWSLWTSKYEPVKKTWSDAHAIPLTSSDNKPFQNILDYSVIQSSRGWWMIAYGDVISKKVVFTRSQNLKNWQRLPKFTKSFLRGVELMEGSTGKFRLVGHKKRGGSLMYESNDGKDWKYINIKNICSGVIKLNCDRLSGWAHSTHLLNYKNGKLLFLTSDHMYGLKFAIFDPYGEIPKIDLVTKTNAQPYDIIKDGNRYLIALKEKDGVTIRRYQDFKTHPDSAENGQIYNEVEYDADNNRWDRIFATVRYIQPDVTSIGVGKDNTRWWGIETGLMALSVDDDFFMQDVSGGHFYHYTSTIESCDAEQAYVASNELKQSRIALVDSDVSFVANMMTKGRNAHITLDGGKGAVMDLLCGASKGTVYAATNKGDLFFVSGQNSRKLYTYGSGGITSLSKSKRGDVIFGTSDGKIYSYAKGQIKLITNVAGKVYDVVEDKSGTIWIAAKGQGLLSYNEKIGLKKQDVSYKDIGFLAVDPEHGIWYVAGDEAMSHGLGYFNEEETLFNPASHRLDQPSGLKVDSNGRVVIGTLFDGLYSFTPKERQKERRTR